MGSLDGSKVEPANRGIVKGIDMIDEKRCSKEKVEKTEHVL